MAEEGQWGFVEATLVGTGAPGSSDWGFVQTEISGPVQPGTSAWDPEQYQLLEAHRPYLILLEDGSLVGSPMLVLQANGTLA